MECALVELDLELEPFKFGNFTEDCTEERDNMEDLEELDNSTGKDFKDYEIFDFRGTVNIISYSVMSAGEARNGTAGNLSSFIEFSYL